MSAETNPSSVLIKSGAGSLASYVILYNPPVGSSTHVALIKGILYRVKELTIFGSPSMNGACIGVSVLGLGYALLPTITVS